MIERATRAVYSALMWSITPLLRIKIARRGKIEAGYLDSVQQRFGRYEQTTSTGSIWLHAVSLGETRAAAPLIAELRQRMPGMRLLLTSGTATGRAEAARLLRPGDMQVWQPWDTPAAVERFLAHFKPCIGVLMETEIWPNLCAGCERAGVPLVLANARMSEKSYRRTQPFDWLARPAYRSLAAVWAQTDADADRLAALGAPVAGVFGNLKFDARPDPNQRAQGAAWRAGVDRPVLMFASSREGEEALLLQFLEQNRAKALVQRSSSAIHSVVNRVQWLIVPRHPQRFDDVARLVESHGFQVARRSHWGERPPPLAADESVVWLGDSLGEMALYYSLADVALLGGSFEPLGGQNLIEAAACGCPVVMGPHTFNFAEAAELALKAGAAQRVDSIEQAIEAATAIASDADARETASSAALAFCAAHRDAARRTAVAIESLIAARARDSG